MRISVSPLVTVVMVLAAGSQVLAADGDQRPDLDLLEYLGEWEDEQGDWLDPLLLAEQADDSNSGGGEKQ